jgi:hypothetical protein
MRCGERALFDGMLGRRGGKLAVRIDSDGIKETGD